MKFFICNQIKNIINYIKSLLKMKPSFIKNLAKNIAGSPSFIAPERVPELAEICTKNNIKIIIETEGKDRNKNFHVIVSSKTVKVGEAALEELWCHCYAYWFLVEYFEIHGSGVILEVNKSTEFKIAMDLLNWAVKPSEREWPQNLPQPANGQCTLEGRAREMFIFTVGWCLLHEIGHIVCGHDEEAATSDISKQQERDADDWAHRWILDKWTDYSGPNDLILGKRTSGIMLGLIFIGFHEIYQRKKGGNTHPDPVERLMNFAAQYIPNETDDGQIRPSDFALYVCIIAFKLHFDAKGIALEAPEGGFSSAFNALREMMRTLRDLD